MPPLPKRMLSTIFGLTCEVSAAAQVQTHLAGRLPRRQVGRVVRRERDLPVPGASDDAQERRTHMITTSSAVSGKVRIRSMRGALVPSVNCVRRSESRKPGQLALRI